MKSDSRKIKNYPVFWSLLAFAFSALIVLQNASAYHLDQGIQYCAETSIGELAYPEGEQPIAQWQAVGSDYILQAPVSSLLHQFFLLSEQYVVLAVSLASSFDEVITTNHFFKILFRQIISPNAP